MPVSYVLDITGILPDNLVKNEIHVLTEINASTYRLLIPEFSPFYLDNFQLSYIDVSGNSTPMQEGIDFNFTLPFIGATRSIGKMLYGGVTINNNLIDGILKVQYQTLGGSWVADASLVATTLAEGLYNPKIVSWDLVTNIQQTFPPINHDDHMNYLFGHQQLIDAINALALVIGNNPNPNSDFISHILDLQNPHQVTKEQIGLGNVPNLPLASPIDIANLSLVDKFISLKQLIGILASYTPSGGGTGGSVTNITNITQADFMGSAEAYFLYRN
jgi:hypothetical protein